MLSVTYTVWLILYESIYLRLWLMICDTTYMTHRCTISSIQLDDKSISVWQIPLFSLKPVIEFLSFDPVFIICLDPVRVCATSACPRPSGCCPSPSVFLFSRCSWTICIFLLDSIGLKQNVETLKQNRSPKTRFIRKRLKVNTFN